MSATTHLLAWLICQTCKFKLDPIYKLQNDELFNQLSSARRMFGEGLRVLETKQGDILLRII